MPTTILLSVISITLSLLFYIIVYFMNKKAKIFNTKQMVVLSFGASADLLGTAMMMALSKGINYDLHTVSGFLALGLMLLMTVVGFYALIKKNQSLLLGFGRYYLPILIIWIISYVTGIVVGLQKIS